MSLGAPPAGFFVSVVGTGRHVALNTFAHAGGAPGRLTFHDVNDGRVVAELPGTLACAGAALAGGRVLCAVARPGPIMPKWGDIVTPRWLVAYDAATGASLWERPLDPRRDYRCPPLP